MKCFEKGDKEMKDIFSAPFLEEMKKTTANMYRLGWDERNGGNISWMLDEAEVGEYLDLYSYESFFSCFPEVFRTFTQCVFNLHTYTWGCA